MSEKTFDNLAVNPVQERMIEAVNLLPNHPEIIGKRENPTVKKECFLAFKENAHEGTEIKSNQAIIISIPEDMNPKLLDSITLKHRKSSQYQSSISSNGWDSEGAYTRVLVFDGKNKEWMSWPDPYKGKSGIDRGDKFAEPRSASNPESEVLYDWMAKTGEINPQFIAVIGAGKGERGIVNYHGIDIDLFPEKLETKQELIFSPGTKFVDENNREPSYGGGMKYRGKYPQSVPLNNYDADSLSFPVSKKGENYYLDEMRRLHLTIDKDMEISRLEVAAGDTEDTGEANKDGHIGRLGWAKLDAFIVKSNGVREQIMDTVNVPPNGVLKGSPEKKMALSKGDEIIVESKNDAAFVMGIRIQ